MHNYFALWSWAHTYLRAVRPQVDDALGPWQARAQNIPDPRLREHALSSLTHKQFHCQGAGVLASPARDPKGRVLAFVIPYQTLCDYLDTVTDRGPSKDPQDLRQLHQALFDAVTPGGPVHDYYQIHPQRNDGGYLRALVKACQHALDRLPGYPWIQAPVWELVERYVALQVFKHGPVNDRIPQLIRWHHLQDRGQSGLAWWEYAAACGSTLGLFALLGLAPQASPSLTARDRLHQLYFPWMSALHILLDYYIDQVEDLAGGDLNLVSFYRSPEQLVQRLGYLYRMAIANSQGLPDAAFHRYVARGLLGFYLADPKLRGQRWTGVPLRLLAGGGLTALTVWWIARYARAP